MDLIRRKSFVLPNKLIKFQKKYKELQQDVIRLDSILENAGQAIIVIDQDKRIILFSKGAEAIFGFFRDEILGQSLDTLILNEDSEMHQEINQLVNEIPPSIPFPNHKFEAQGKRKGGDRFPAQIVISKHFKDGNPIYAAIIDDITDRRLSEDKIKKSDALLQLQMDRMPIACIVWDTQFRVVSWNPAAKKIFGFDLEEVLGKYPYMFLVEDNLKNHQDNISSRLLEGDDTAYSTNVNLTKDGRKIICNWTNTPLKEPNGDVIGVLSMVQDVTMQTESVMALKASEERYHELFKRIPVALYQFSTEGKIIDANPALVDLLGYPDKETLLINNATDIYAEVEERFGKIIKVELEDVVHNSRLQLYDHNGNIIWVKDRWHTVYKDGAVVYEGSFEDITEQVQAEERIRRNTSRAQLLVEISQLIAEVGLNYQSILDIVTLRVSEWIGDACAITIYKEGRSDLDIASIYHPNFDVVDLLREIIASSRIGGDGLPEFLLASNQPIFKEDIPQDRLRSVLSSSYWTSLNQNGIFSLLIVPLRAQGQVIGMIGVTRNTPGCSYKNEDYVFLQDIADRTALAITNAQLFERAQHNLNKLESLRLIDIAIASSLDLRVSLGVILDQIIMQTGVDATDVLVFNPHTYTLDFSIGRGFRTKALQNTRLRLGEGYAGQAALDRKILNIPDLRMRGTDLLRSPNFFAESFIAYFAIPLVALGQVKGVLEIFHRGPLNPDAEWLDFLEALAGQTAIAIDSINLFNDLQKSNQELITAYDTTIEGWSHALDLRDKETEGHTRRVTDMTLRLARAMNVSETELIHIRRGALLHDIGKMGIPDQILFKPGALDVSEWNLMRKHPLFAYEMIVSIPYLKPALDIPYCHHEKWDGTGYPRSLKGEDIPLAARLFAVVDVWDALSSDRPYRSSWSNDKVREYIQSQAGKHFDPRIVKAFLKLLENG